MRRRRAAGPVVLSAAVAIGATAFSLTSASPAVPVAAHRPPVATSADSLGIRLDRPPNARDTAAYCTALRTAIDSAKSAIHRPASQRRSAYAVVAARYGVATVKAPDVATRRAMLAAGVVYVALAAGDDSAAARSNIARFAAVPDAAPQTRRSCGIDLFRPTDYEFSVRVAT